ncbi:uncharacterized protein LOC112575051 [Pomacea canaliculata]|uniref:uncharacterized protein LOC112575051 n=1 Tax=Pomacea canaliculata TaxID=400727 RepID=UPI000D73E03E|nr:uncharacterized protein LOC112575051 [Pomacea canaliculata]
MDRDDVSVTSSLAEFEKLEREIDQSGSNNSVDRFVHESKSSGGKSGSGSGSGSVAGSVSSLAEFEKLEAECMGDSDERRSSEDSSLHRRSETSSLASLTEFERIERDLLMSNELEAEAQKIVSILESGNLESALLFAAVYSGSDVSEAESKPDKDKDMEHDSLSEGDREEEPDSLDTSEMTDMTSSVIFAGPDLTTVQPGTMPELDGDSLAGECIMQLSSDSLVLTQQLRTSDSSKFETDSLYEQEDIFIRSTDSLEFEKRSDKCDQDSLQEDIMQASTDSLELVQVEHMPDNIMLMSVESARWSMASSGCTAKSAESHTDSHDFMQVSVDSVEDLKASRSEHTLKMELSQTAQITTKSAKTVKPHPTNPFLDDEGNVMQRDTYSDDDEEEEAKEKESPFMSWGPYTERKKVYTMAEWEAMKKEKLREREEGYYLHGTASTVPTQATARADRSEDRSGLSEEESGEVEASESFGEEEMQTHRLLMKKEVHSKTVIGPDGHEETFIREDSQIHQDSEPPEELRDSMQQIINQFMEDPTAPVMGGEDAPKELEEGTEV